MGHIVQAAPVCHTANRLEGTWRVVWQLCRSRGIFTARRKLARGPRSRHFASCASFKFCQFCLRAKTGAALSAARQAAGLLKDGRALPQALCFQLSKMKRATSAAVIATRVAPFANRKSLPRNPQSAPIKSKPAFFAVFKSTSESPM